MTFAPDGCARMKFAEQTHCWVSPGLRPCGPSLCLRRSKGTALWRGAGSPAQGPILLRQPGRQAAPTVNSAHPRAGPKSSCALILALCRETETPRCSGTGQPPSRDPFLPLCWLHPWHSLLAPQGKKALWTSPWAQEWPGTPVSLGFPHNQTPQETPHLGYLLAFREKAGPYCLP